MSELSDKIDQLTKDVAAATSASTSAQTLIQGFVTEQAAAIQKALDAGATPEQLKALSDLHQLLNSSSSALSAAVEAGLPAVPAQPTGTVPVGVATPPAPVVPPTPAPAPATPPAVDPTTPTTTTPAASDKPTGTPVAL